MNKTSRLGSGKSFLLSFLFLTFASLLLTGCGGSKFAIEGLKTKNPPVVVFQPSHQSDTGREFNEALVCNGIVDSAMARPTGIWTQYKVWSYNVEGLHHAKQGSNTKIDHTSALDSGRISGYAYELIESNKVNPDIFIAVHNNGATNRNACWGFVHEGDPQEAINRKFTALFVEEICRVTDLDNAGVHGDSEPNRNDYRCITTGKLCFYSLDEHVNNAPYRILLEIGDNKVSRELLTDPNKQKIIGNAMRRVLEAVCAEQR